MEPDELRDALQEAVELRQQGQRTEHDAIVAALRGGVKQVDVVKVTGYSRETIRRIARADGVPLLREPTVVSKRKIQ